MDASRARRAEASGRPPHGGEERSAREPYPGGYEDGGGSWPPGGPDLSALLVLLDALRRPLPPELRRQFGALLREALLTLRALIDWYLERLEGPPRRPRVEDIPID